MQFIGINYNNIKDTIERIRLPFDHDIFLDTIMKCNDKLSEVENQTAELMTGYVIAAYKKNLLREKQYARNKVVEPLTENHDFEDEEYDYSIDVLVDKIKSLLEKEFGSELTKLWIQHVLGATYEELDKMTAITNLHYKFKCMRLYLRKNLKS